MNKGIGELSLAVKYNRQIYRKSQAPLSIYIETRISELGVSDLGKAEILHEIKVAEEKVRAMIKEAEDRRKQLQAEGKRLALEKTESADAALRRKLDSEVAVAQAQIDAQKKALLEEGVRKADALAADARKRMRQAKDFVLSEFERAVDA